MSSGFAFTRMRVVEPELVAAVVAHRHRRWAEMDNLDVVGVAALRPVHMVAPMNGGQRGPDDRVWAVRSHVMSVGRPVQNPERMSATMAQK